MRGQGIHGKCGKRKRAKRTGSQVDKETSRPENLGHWSKWNYHQPMLQRTTSAKRMWKNVGNVRQRKAISLIVWKDDKSGHIENSAFCMT